MGLVEIFLKSSNMYYQKRWKNIDVFYGQLHTRTIYVKYDLGRKIRYSCKGPCNHFLLHNSMSAVNQSL